MTAKVRSNKKDLIFFPPIILKSTCYPILSNATTEEQAAPLKMPYLQKQDTQPHQVLNDFYDSHRRSARAHYSCLMYSFPQSREENMITSML